MKKTAIIFASLLAAGAAASAQGINQSVQVTNDFETEFADFKKMEPALVLPDSLYRFDYSFDYSVFDSPYRGSYEFSPYNVAVVPDVDFAEASRFYLRAGAGYTLHPVLDVVYTPVSARGASLSLYNFGKGYYGSRFYDFHDRAGLSGRWVLSSSVLDYAAGYDGIFTGVQSSAASNYHSGFASLGFRSSSADPTFLSYALKLDYRYSADFLPSAETSEHYFRLEGSVGPVIAERYRFLLDFNFDIAALGDSRPAVETRIANFAKFKPHLKFTPGVFDIDAGLVVDYLLDGSSRFYLAPDISAGVDLFDGSMKVTAAFKGGSSVLSYHRLKSLNHFYTRASSDPDLTRTRYDASLSVEGSIASRLQYALSGGYASLADAPLDSLGTLGFADYRLAYAGASLCWKSERFDADASMLFRYADIAPEVNLYAPAMFKVDASMSYNWMKRIYASVSVDASSRRVNPSGLAPDIPSYMDLGVGADYWVRRSLSVWLHLGNLLNMDIQRCPGFVESGIYFTMGLALKF